MSSALTQSGPYMPDDDFGLVSWMRNFARKIEAQPGKYGLSTGDASVIVNAYEQYQQAFERTQDPTMRTPSAIAEKDAARNSARGTMRTYAAIIRANLGVDNQSLVNLRLTPRNASRRSIKAPATAPVIQVRAAFPLVHEMTYHDESTSTTRRKPYGVTLLEMHWWVIEPGSQVHPDRLDPLAAPNRRAFTKTPFMVEHSADDAGKTAVYFARWMTGTGQTGPWSVPCWFTIAAGGNALDQSGVLSESAVAGTQQRSAA